MLYASFSDALFSGGRSWFNARDLRLCEDCCVCLLKPIYYPLVVVRVDECKPPCVGVHEADWEALIVFGFFDEDSKGAGGRVRLASKRGRHLSWAAKGQGRAGLVVVD